MSIAHEITPDIRDDARGTAVEAYRDNPNDPEAAKEQARALMRARGQRAGMSPLLIFALVKFIIALIEFWYSVSAAPGEFLAGEPTPESLGL